MASVDRFRGSQPPPKGTPLAPERYRIQLTVNRATHDKLRRAQALLPHVAPEGDPAIVFDRAPTVLEQLERRKLVALLALATIIEMQAWG